MAIAIGFGVLFATFITLIMVPCLYLILEDIIQFVKKSLGIVGLGSKSTSNSSLASENKIKQF